jgi:taurine dioxygenase
VDIGENTAATSFASGALAYKALPHEMKESLLGLQSLNCLTIKLDARTYEMDVPPQFPRALHPVVIRHPGTTEPILYVNYMQTSRILGMREDESEALLNKLFAQLYAPENIYHHRWQKGDLVIWDNLALQHARLTPVDERRTLQRVTGGAVGMRTLFPHTRILFGESSDSNVVKTPSKKTA